MNTWLNLMLYIGELPVVKIMIYIITIIKLFEWTGDILN